MPSRYDAIAGFYAQKADELRRAVRHAISGPEAMIEDACSYAWYQILRSEGIALDHRGFAWLYVVAIREAYRLSERARREPALGAPQDLPLANQSTDDHFGLVERRDRHARRVRLLAGLPQRQQRMVLLHAAGFTYREIAALTGATLRTVERQVLRGKRTLRRMDGDAKTASGLR